jgi:hypothetical protein
MKSADLEKSSEKEFVLTSTDPPPYTEATTKWPQ